MSNKIKKLDECFWNEDKIVLAKLNEVIGMVNEHTDKLNEIVKKLNSPKKPNKN